jgi:hypothetical protein
MQVLGLQPGTWPLRGPADLVLDHSPGTLETGDKLVGTGAGILVRQGFVCSAYCRGQARPCGAFQRADAQRGPVPSGSPSRALCMLLLPAAWWAT